MNVKAPFKISKSLKFSKYLLYLVLIVIMGLAYKQWTQKPDVDWQEDQVELGLRHVGDQLMKQYGDKESPIPPIVQTGDYDFSLNLPQPVALNPDDLTGIALKTFNKGHFQKAIVQVYANQTSEMVYGFNIDTREQGEVPCLGRVLPIDDYHIKLKVLDPATGETKLQVAMMSIAGLGLMVMILAGFSGLPKAAENRSLKAAGMQLDLERSMLSHQGNQVKLTHKEARLAELLMKQAGQLVSREFLVEEIWAKEGVITGRSLDVFISRLRKKFAINPQVQIVNKHGKGYVLEVNSGE